MGVLGALAILGVAAGLARLFVGLGGTTALNDSTSWGIWIGFDFGLIAFSGAAFTLAALVHVFHMERFHAALRPALLAGLLGYVAVLLLLVLDLGRPDRFYNFLLYWNLHSPLFEISCCVLLYTTVLLLEVAPDVFERFGWTRLRKWVLFAMPAVTIIGVTLSTLHQSTLGTLYLNMPHRLSPLWWTPILPVLFFTSAVMAGLSMAIIAYRSATRLHLVEEDPAVLRGLGVGVAGVSIAYLAMRAGAIAANGSWRTLALNDSHTWLLAGELLLGALLPAVLFLSMRRSEKGWVYWVAPLLVMGGVLFNRFNATLYGQTSPIDRGAYAPSIMEWVSTLGIISAAVLLWMIAVHWLVRFDEHNEQSKHNEHAGHAARSSVRQEAQLEA
jgi:Ni/Fe-hydrogenase subunit HybB-like protein